MYIFQCYIKRPAKDPSVIDDFESAETGSSAGWEQEGGWQYDNAVGISVAEFQGSKMLKADLDYTGCEGFTWSEAKIKKSFAEGLDVSAYNVLSYEISSTSGMWHAADASRIRISIPLCTISITSVTR